MKTQEQYKQERVTRTSINVLNCLAEKGLTMYDGMKLRQVAKDCITTVDNVAKNAERNHVPLTIIKEQAAKIAEMETQIKELRLMLHQSMGTDMPVWTMTTEAFNQHLKETWVDPCANKQLVDSDLMVGHFAKGCFESNK